MQIAEAKINVRVPTSPRNLGEVGSLFPLCSASICIYVSHTNSNPMAPTNFSSLLFTDLLAQVSLVAQFFYLVDLRFEPINVLFFILQQSLEEFA